MYIQSILEFYSFISSSSPQPHRCMMNPAFLKNCFLLVKDTSVSKGALCISSVMQLFQDVLKPPTREFKIWNHIDTTSSTAYNPIMWKKRADHWMSNMGLFLLSKKIFLIFDVRVQRLFSRILTILDHSLFMMKWSVMMRFSRYLAECSLYYHSFGRFRWKLHSWFFCIIKNWNKEWHPSWSLICAPAHTKTRRSRCRRMKGKAADFQWTLTFIACV